MLGSLFKFIADMPKIKKLVEDTIVDKVELLSGKKTDFSMVGNDTDIVSAHLPSHLSLCAEIGKLHANQRKSPDLIYNWTEEQKGVYMEYYNNQADKIRR